MKKPIIVNEREYNEANKALGRVGIVMGFALAAFVGIVALGVDKAKDGKLPVTTSQPVMPNAPQP